MGYAVTVYEKEVEPGGMLKYAIPPYRLPDRILKREIDWIKNFGVEIKTGSKVKDPISLFNKGFSAVLIAGGAPKSFPLGIPGEKVEGVVDALIFLKNVNEKKSSSINGKVVVIGGGSTAFDSARSAVRLDAKKVILAYRRGIEEMPAELEEIEAAQEEGVKILTHAIPKKINGKNGKVTNIEFLKAKLGKPDESGRRRPVPIKNSNFLVKADIIIPAVGAMPDVGPIGGVKVTTSKGIVNVSEYGKTVVKGVFAAGDVEMGPSSVVEAIGRGHEAAKGIHSYLRKTKPFENKESIQSIQISIDSSICSNNKYIPKRKTDKEIFKTFEEVEKSFTDFEAVEEASRCLSCGTCNVCPTCLPNCENKQLAAEIKNNTFLVKSPLILSKNIYEKRQIDFKLKSGERIKLISLTSKIDPDLCIGCGRCEELCAYHAIQNVILKDKRTISKISLNACSSCSACVSACPSAAISQGYMSDEDILKRLETNKTPFSGVKGLINYWNTSNPSFNTYDGFIDLMSIGKPSPSFLIRALARAGRGLLVIRSNKFESTHYLPWEESPDEVFNKTWILLKSVGISPDRIQYVDLQKDGDPTIILKKFSKKLDDKKLKPLKIPLPREIKNPIGEIIAILRIFSANPDAKPKDDLVTSNHTKKRKTAIFEGCIPMLHLIGSAHKFYDISPTRIAIRKLLDEFSLDADFIDDFNCPSKGLLSLKLKGIEEIVEKIAKKNKKYLDELKPDKLILCTPEGYTSFLEDNNYQNVVSLIDELLIKAKRFKGFKPLNKIVAIHHACRLKSDPFYDATKQFLKQIPGVKIIELKDKCGQTGFDKLDGKFKQSAVALMKKASEKGADIIVCSSPYCLSHLLLCSRKGSWQTVDIEISDIFQLLYSSITGDI
jgi:NADPH-dependent glutamate synthase beta subunit-like oxidoreductase/Fe-S oxidoreductase/ferredoxin